MGTYYLSWSLLLNVLARNAWMRNAPEWNERKWKLARFIFGITAENWTAVFRGSQVNTADKDFIDAYAPVRGIVLIFFGAMIELIIVFVN